MSARFIVGDVFEVLASLPDNSVDFVMTSPPFLALRSYLPADHPDKAKEIGSEPTPADFIDTMLDVVEACDRVLAPHGSLVFEIGDTYSGSGGGGGDYLPGGLREGQPGFVGSAKKALDADEVRAAAAAHGRSKNSWRSNVKQDGEPTGGRSGRSGRSRDSWPLDKSLCGIPTLFAWSLAYGRNLLRLERETDPWRIRNVVAWVRPNPPVGALGDKFRPATSFLTVATKSRTRYFDLDAVRGRPEDVKDQRARSTNGVKNSDADPSEVQTANYTESVPSHPNGAPPLDYWELSTRPYKGSHYATYPPALCERPIKSMCPEWVCLTCGEPRRRIAESTNATGKASRRNRVMADRKDVPVSSTHFPRLTERRTLGWTDCGHDNYRRGVVLDPFAGSGTTLRVATDLGREAIGIDLDSRNADLALARCGMFLTVETFQGDEAAS